MELAIGAGVTLLAVIWAIFTGRSWGKSSAEAKQADRDRKAAADRIEMAGERNDIAGRVSAMPDDVLDAEVRKRARQ
jgi:hypothetical protein